ncbi:MAG: DUF1667 domain-containing protein [Myxococcales bacterium]|nr:MAG: DUF1667 domain-containing protein [Myxococcales bacterium]
MEITHYLCIGCPLGCRLEVEHEEKSVVEVRGHSCKKGKEFAKDEHTDPRRMVTTTVRVSGGLWPKLPVKTRAPVPKPLVKAVCEELHKVALRAPVKMGDVIVSDILQTGVDIVATRDMPRVEG